MHTDIVETVKKFNVTDSVPVDFVFDETKWDVTKRVNSMAKLFKETIDNLENKIKILSEENKELRKCINKMRDQYNMPLRYESEEQGELRAALAQASLDCLVPDKTGNSQGGKPSFTVDDLRAASREALKKNNIGIVFEERKDLDNKNVLITILTHVPSNQFKTFTTTAEPTNNPVPAHATKGGYSLAMKRMLGQLLNLGGD